MNEFVVNYISRSLELIKWVYVIWRTPLDGEKWVLWFWVYNTMIILGFEKNKSYNKMHSYMPNDFTSF
jgi:hypothetical protein